MFRPYCTLSLILIGIGLSVVAIASPLRVVTTVAPLTDITRRVGSTAIHLHGLVPEGVNSHTFQPTPRDVQYLAEADLVILNGLYLEIPTEKLARSSGKKDAVIIKLADQTLQQADWIYDFSFPRAQGYPNPHLWLDVDHTMTYVRLIRDQLSQLDPDHQDVYHHHAARYLQQLSKLHHCIQLSVQTIPPPNRKLLTYHDSWPYFARRYGLQVIGVVQPMPFSEPSARQIGQLIRQIQQTGVPAIFGSVAFPSNILSTIAAETQVTYVKTLRDDNLPGEPGEPQHSYLGMMLTNVRTMVTALGGNSTSLTTCAAHLLDKKE